MLCPIPSLPCPCRFHCSSSPWLFSRLHRPSRITTHLADFANSSATSSCFSLTYISRQDHCFLLLLFPVVAGHLVTTGKFRHRRSTAVSDYSHPAPSPPCASSEPSYSCNRRRSRPCPPFFFSAGRRTPPTTAHVAPPPRRATGRVVFCNSFALSSYTSSTHLLDLYTSRHAGVLEHRCVHAAELGPPRPSSSAPSPVKPASASHLGEHLEATRLLLLTSTVPYRPAHVRRRRQGRTTADSRSRPHPLPPSGRYRLCVHAPCSPHPPGHLFAVAAFFRPSPGTPASLLCSGRRRVLVNINSKNSRGLGAKLQTQLNSVIWVLDLFIILLKYGVYFIKIPGARL